MPNKPLMHQSGTSCWRWTVFKSQFCGFSAQKYSIKLQLKNYRLARHYANRSIFLALGMSLLLTACMPLVQIDWASSDEEIRIAPERDELAVTVLTSSPQEAQKIFINSSSSYAISPEGVKYEIEFARNQYATKLGLEDNSPWASFFVSLKKSPGQKAVELENGDWELFLAFGNANRGDIKAKFKLWTFWYSPLIHGPPN